MTSGRIEPLTIAVIAEHVAFEVEKDAADFIRSKRVYDVWLRRVVFWLARHVARQSLRDIGDALGRHEANIGHEVRRADRLYAADAEFRRLTIIVAGALATVPA